ncbi:hypothetical protein MKW98_010838 [Papaver atlanticum]|uniref:TOD1/MUCI70 glycosyltransferase-like domain-containing protein n=1 Tax=Papaver atlanticum TaxID=357466 RepID=A0AAD4SNU9_9MAGN|nr:hypothetical protein MKW98_010838 [Papaver atlanticum]
MDSEAHRSVSLRATRRADRNNTQSHIDKDVESGPFSPLVRTPQDYPFKIVWRKGFIRLVLVAGILWVLIILTVLMLHVWSCQTSITFLSAICNREGKFMLVLNSLGFTPKPLHRCTIPVANDPDSIVIPEKRTPDNTTFWWTSELGTARTKFLVKFVYEGALWFHTKWSAEMEPADVKYAKKCRFVVASAIFDGYDTPHQPSNISRIQHMGRWQNGTYSRFVAYFRKVGLVRSCESSKFGYLWRDKNTFAIARHKHHQSIYEEADAIKRRKRGPRPLIDLHAKIYVYEGMEPWSVKKNTISDVPEGAIIIREHTALNNLFSCLWFNEVNLFTPRDQLSFGYVVYRLGSAFKFYMFPNCEYNSLFVLHSHTREHSSVVEWVKSLDEFKRNSTLKESRGGLGLWMRYPGDLDSVSLPPVTRTSQAG